MTFEQNAYMYISDPVRKHYAYFHSVGDENENSTIQMRAYKRLALNDTFFLKNRIKTTDF